MKKILTLLVALTLLPLAHAEKPDHAGKGKPEKSMEKSGKEKPESKGKSEDKSKGKGNSNKEEKLKGAERKIERLKTTADRMEADGKTEQAAKLREKIAEAETKLGQKKKEMGNDDDAPEREGMEDKDEH